MSIKFINPGVLRKGAIRLVDPKSLDPIGEERRFIYNPNKISDKKTSNWVEHKIPSMSHPVYQWGGGGARTVEFMLFVTGDRPGEPSITTIEDEIMFYQSLQYSMSSNGQHMPPPLVELWFGSMYGGLDDKKGLVDKLSSYLQKGVNSVTGFLAQNLNFTISGKELGFGSALGDALGSVFPNFKPNLSPSRNIWMVNNVEVEILKWNYDLRPYEAEIRLVLEQYAESTITREQFVRGA